MTQGNAYGSFSPLVGVRCSHKNSRFPEVDVLSIPNRPSFKMVRNGFDSAEQGKEPTNVNCASNSKDGIILRKYVLARGHNVTTQKFKP